MNRDEKIIAIVIPLAVAIIGGIFTISGDNFTGSFDTENMNDTMVNKTPNTKDERLSDKEYLKISDSLKNELHEKIKIDLPKILEFTKSETMQIPFGSDELKSDELVHCTNAKTNEKCSILKEIRKKISSTPYMFVFVFPDQQIETTEGEIAVQDCRIEIIEIDSLDVTKITNKWNDREWCTHYYYYSLTNQYIPRGLPEINVNSLSLTYFDSNGTKLGIVNAYNLEQSISNYMKNSEIETFNVILLDELNCVSGAISKVKGHITTHLEEGVWRLDKNEDKGIVEHVASNDEIKNTNCHNESKYVLDAINSIDITVIQNSGNGDSSILDGTYHVFEMDPLTQEELGKPPGIVKIFRDWKILVS